MIRRDLVVYLAVNRKVHLPLLSHREHIKKQVCTVQYLSYPRVTFELPLSYVYYEV